MADNVVTQHMLDRVTDDLRRDLIATEGRLMASLHQHIISHKDEHIRIDAGFARMDDKLDSIGDAINVWRGQLRIILGVLGVAVPILTALLLRVL